MKPTLWSDACLKLVLLAFILLVGMICIDNTSINETTNTGNKMGQQIGGVNLGQTSLQQNAARQKANTVNNATSSWDTSRSFANVLPALPEPQSQQQSQADYTDPYAAWGGQSAYNALVNDFNAQKGNIRNSANEAGDAYGSQYGRGITTFLENARLGQNSLDLKGAKNELAKTQGVQGVLGMVGRGIKSAGVMLAGKNAGNSSAAGALANAYGDQGRRQLGSIGNQYEMGNQEIATDQNAFDVQQNQGVRELQGKKDDFINSTVLDARNQLAALDAKIAGASLPQRIAIDQEKESIKQTLLQKLQGFDSQLTQGRAGIQASSVDQRRQAASDMARAGQSLGADAFQYSTETPGQFQGTGPFSSELPLFTLGKRRVA